MERDARGDGLSFQFQRRVSRVNPVFARESLNQENRVELRVRHTICRLRALLGHMYCVHLQSPLQIAVLMLMRWPSCARARNQMHTDSTCLIGLGWPIATAPLHYIALLSVDGNDLDIALLDRNECTLLSDDEKENCRRRVDSC